MLPGSALHVSVGGGGGVGSTALCGHTNFVFGLKLGCDNKNFKQFDHEMYECCCALLRLFHLSSVLLECAVSLFLCNYPGNGESFKTV